MLNEQNKILCFIRMVLEAQYGARSDILSDTSRYYKNLAIYVFIRKLRADEAIGNNKTIVFLPVFATLESLCFSSSNYD